MYNLTDSQFFRELPEFLQYCNTMSGSPIIVGDFNVHVENPSNYKALQLSSIFEDFGLIQSAIFPTHQTSNTLDLVLTCQDDHLLQTINPTSLSMSLITIASSARSETSALYLLLSTPRPGTFLQSTFPPLKMTCNTNFWHPHLSQLTTVTVFFRLFLIIMLHQLFVGSQIYLFM